MTKCNGATRGEMILGAGAGLAGLLAPTMAQAQLRGVRRRFRTACPCPESSTEPLAAPGQSSRGLLKILDIIGAPAPPCSPICPYLCLGSIGGICFYQCTCCGGGGGNPDVFYEETNNGGCRTGSQLNQNCGSGSCITPPGAIILRTTTGTPDWNRPFKDSTILNNGLSAPIGALGTTDFTPVSAVAIAENMQPVSFQTLGGRMVWARLFVLYTKDSTGARQLRVGLETSAAGTTSQPVNVQSINSNGHHYCLQFTDPALSGTNWYITTKTT